MKIRMTCLSLACASLIPLVATATEPEINFYGSLRVQLEKTGHTESTDFKDAASRIGVDGRHQLDESMTAFAKYEVALDLDEREVGDERQGYVGLTGDFGTLMAGRYWSAFYNAVGYAGDQLWWDSAPAYYTLDGDFRIGDSIMYTSPDISGLQLSVLAQFDDDSNDDEVEQSQYTATYQASDSLKLAVGYINDDNDSVGVAAYYTGEGFYINGAYIDKDNAGKGADLIGGIRADKSLYTLALSTLEDESGAGSDFDAVTLGYQYDFHPKVKLWVEAMAWDGVLYGNEDSHTVNIGMNYDF